MPRWAGIGIFLILFFGALYFSASFVLPVVIALLFMLVLSPVVRFSRRRLGLWEPVTATILVIGTLVMLVSSFYLLSDPLTQMARDAPKYIEAVNKQVSNLRDRMAEFQGARSDARAAIGPETPPAESQEVVLGGPTLLNNVAAYVPQAGASIAFALIFLFFLLSSGSLFYRRVIESMPTLSDKKKALLIAHEIEKELSRYLFTITLINAGLGCVIGLLMWSAGMPMPAVFGVLAFLLNYIPYLGAATGVALAGVVGLTGSGELLHGIIPAALYFGATVIEGQIVTPILVGRRLAMNAAAVFLSVAFWGWIWGVVGMFLAVPIMVGIKIFATYIETLQPLANFLSADQKASEDHSETS